MVEMVLPGTYIEVRPEGLITPARVSVGTIGIVGTASKGPVGEAVFLGSYVEARERFGPYDAWPGDPAGKELSLVRALEIAYAHGATTVIAVRVAVQVGTTKAESASYTLSSANDPAVRLEALSPGTWGNELKVQVLAATEEAYVTDELHDGAATVSLDRGPVAPSARIRIDLTTAADGVTRSLRVFYTGVNAPAALGPDEVAVNPASGDLTFPAGVTLSGADKIRASYAVAAAGASTVVLTNGRNEERYTVVSGDQLITALEASSWVRGTTVTAAESTLRLEPTPAPANFAGGANGHDTSPADAEYKDGLAVLENEAAHIIVAAGRNETFADELKAHCELASSDALRRDRIGVVGSRKGATLDQLRGHNLDSDRLVYVAPGIKATDAASGKEETLGGAYAAAAIAGLLSSYPPHVSLTNKVLSVGDLETRFTPTQLSQLVQSRILAL
ncbi:MAG TPA: phage tail sheath protein, partial [Acidimicrobiia bacterium]|nr:phage tail sheath protein [Acidimicrobiia bacterium]